MARAIKKPEPVVVNPEKIVRGMTTVFQGFSIMFDGLSEQLSLMQSVTDRLAEPDQVSEPVAEKTEKKEASGVKTETQEKSDSPTEKIPEGRVPWDSESESDSEADRTDEVPTKEANPAITVTADTIREVVVAKIKQNRKNNEQIGKLLSAYGVKLLSDLPVEKYEAFLNDISQL